MNRIFCSTVHCGPTQGSGVGGLHVRVCACVCTEVRTGVCAGLRMPVHVNRGVSGGVCALTVTQASRISSPRLWVSRGCTHVMAPPAPSSSPGPWGLHGGCLLLPAPKQHHQAAEAAAPRGEPPPSCLPPARPSPRWAAPGRCQQACSLGPSDPLLSWHLRGPSFGAAAPEKSFPCL